MREELNKTVKYQIYLTPDASRGALKFRVFRDGEPLEHLNRHAPIESALSEIAVIYGGFVGYCRAFNKNLQFEVIQEGLEFITREEIDGHIKSHEKAWRDFSNSTEKQIGKFENGQ